MLIRFTDNKNTIISTANSQLNDNLLFIYGLISIWKISYHMICMANHGT